MLTQLWWHWITARIVLKKKKEINKVLPKRKRANKITYTTINNLVEGQDFELKMIMVNQSLIEATVTIWYKKPDGSLTINVAPTSIDAVTNTITFKIHNTESIRGIWIIWVKIINKVDKVYFSRPRIALVFNERLI